MNNTVVSQFGTDVLRGLSSVPKYLSSKYFYDAHGDELFRKIMELDEYYLTRAELSIFQESKNEIKELLTGSQPFRLIELGAGDGAKTQVLLTHFMEESIDFSYHPVDISPNVLDILERNIKSNIPGIHIEPLAGDYLQILHDVRIENHQRNVVFFLGSNIGNFDQKLTRSFLSQIHDNLNKGDLLMIGFDLKKDPAIVLNAYNDKQGVTRDFNLNLLTRINRELGGDFDINSFKHYPTYNPATGECTSYLISLADQKVHLKDLDTIIQLKQWEPIKMEISRKFSTEDIQELAGTTGFRLVKTLHDRRSLFAESIWEVN